MRPRPPNRWHHHHHHQGRVLRCVRFDLSLPFCFHFDRVWVAIAVAGAATGLLRHRSKLGIGGCNAHLRDWPNISSRGGRLTAVARTSLGEASSNRPPPVALRLAYLIGDGSPYGGARVASPSAPASRPGAHPAPRCLGDATTSPAPLSTNISRRVSHGVGERLVERP